MTKSYSGNIVISWLSWQFNEVPAFLVAVWGNYLKFVSGYFSVWILLKSFLSPWHKYQWAYPKGFNVGEFLNTLISNFFSRILGAFMRFFLILFGIISQILVAIIGFCVLVAWILMPFFIAGLFIFSFTF